MAEGSATITFSSVTDTDATINIVGTYHSNRRYYHYICTNGSTTVAEDYGSFAGGTSDDFDVDVSNLDKNSNLTFYYEYGTSTSYGYENSKTQESIILYLYYDAQGGDPTPGTQTYRTIASSHSFTISSTTPSKSGNTFDYWEDAGGSSYDPGDTCRVTHLMGSQTLYAHWSPVTQTYYIEITANTGGTVTSGESGNYYEGDEIDLDCSASTHYTFDKWLIKYDGETEWSTLSSSQSYTYTVLDLDAEIKCTFTEDTKYYITIQAGTGGSVTEGTSGYHYKDDEISLNCTKSTGYDFVNWTANGTSFSTSQSTTYTVSGTATVQCNFQKRGHWAWSNTIASGQPITNLTATDWNAFRAKINTVRALQGLATIVFSNVNPGDTITAATFNQARNAINDLSGKGSICGTVTKNVTSVTAALFDGNESSSDTSLRAALNRAIDNT